MIHNKRIIFVCLLMIATILSASVSMAADEHTSPTDESAGETPEPVVITPTAIKLNKQKKTLKIGKKFRLKATISPANATDKSVTWKSSNKKVATVSKTGLVKAKKKGTAKITCTTNSGGKKATCQIKVKYDVINNKVTAIGDSVMEGASADLHSAIPGIYVDAKVSRQIPAGVDVARSLRANGKLGGFVVVHLGTNWVYDESAYQSMIDAIGPHHVVYWLTIRGTSWDSQANKYIKSIAKKNKNVKVLDWAKYAKGHDEWFYSDRQHLRPSATKKYAKFIKKRIKK